jgi:hypothetical protein
LLMLCSLRIWCGMMRAFLLPSHGACGRPLHGLLQYYGD